MGATDGASRQPAASTPAKRARPAPARQATPTNMTDTHGFALAVNQAADPFFIWPFRLLTDPYLGFFTGLLVWSLCMTLLGELTGLAAQMLHAKRHEKLLDELRHHHNQSVEALHHGSKSGYLGHNKLAQEAYGKVFFSGVAAFLATIWPIPFFLGWLAYRFGDFRFELPFSLPYFGDMLRPEFFFLLIYVLTRVLFSRIKHRLPLFSGMAELRLQQCGAFKSFLPAPPDAREERTP